MKKSLILFAAGAMALGLAAQQSAPVSGTFYKIQHSSGLFLTRDGVKFTIAEEAPDSLLDSQVFLFAETPGAEGAYQVFVDNRKLFASDAGWNATVLSNNQTKYAQFDVAVSDDGTHLTLANLGQMARKGEAKCFLGTDKKDAGAEVYTDKNGLDSLHFWTIAPVADFAFADDTPGPDVYPDFDLPDTDPRKNMYPGYKLVFAEEFNAAEGKPSKDIWNYENGWKRNNEDQYYWDKDNNIWFENGLCVINGRHENPEEVKNPGYDPRHGTGNALKKYLEWTSASIITKGSWDGDYSWMYGIYEVRAKIPAYTGCWPAIWSTGRQYSWPKGGEIDLMEWYGNCIHGNVCWGNTQWLSAVVNYNVLNSINPDSEWRDEYHVWRMFWDYDHIEMWCDDVLVNNIDLNKTVNPVKEGQDWSGKNPFRDVRQVLWLNLAMGGDSGGSLAHCPANNYYMIDYARIYQRIGTDGAATYHVDEYQPDATIMVPDKDDYLQTIGIVSAIADPDDTPAQYYNLQGIPVANPAPGQILIRRQGSSATKIAF